MECPFACKNSLLQTCIQAKVPQFATIFRFRFILSKNERKLSSKAFIQAKMNNSY